MTAVQVQQRIQSDPDWFIQKILGYKLWENPETLIDPQEKYYWDQQRDIVVSARDHEGTMVAGCTGSTKTYAAAILVAWWLSAYEHGRVFTLAPTHRQVRNNLWGYLPIIHKEALIPIGGEILLSPEWRISEDSYAQGFSVKQPENIAGIHGKQDLLIIDDGQGIPQNIFEAAERARAGGTCHVVVLCNPMVLSGEIYDAFHKNRQFWNCIQIPARKTPNYLVEEAWEKKNSKRKSPLPRPPLPIPGAIIKAQCDKWIRKFKKDSNFVRVMVDSEFPKQEADTLIPLDWLHMAKDREIDEKYLDKHIVLGVDVAWQGNDRSVISPLKGLEALQQIEYTKFDPTELSGRVLLAIEQYNSRGEYIDIIGIGSGVVSNLKHAGREQAVGVNVSVQEMECLFEEVQQGRQTIRKRRFANLRSYIWWKMREVLDPHNPLAIKIPDDLELIAELSCVKYSTPSGVITVEGKDKMKARLGFSPDKADALCLAVYGASLKKDMQESRTVTVADLAENSDDEDGEQELMLGRI